MAWAIYGGVNDVVADAEDAEWIRD